MVVSTLAWMAQPLSGWMKAGKSSGSMFGKKLRVSVDLSVDGRKQIPLADAILSYRDPSTGRLIRLESKGKKSETWKGSLPPTQVMNLDLVLRSPFT